MGFTGENSSISGVSFRPFCRKNRSRYRRLEAFLSRRIRGKAEISSREYTCSKSQGYPAPATKMEWVGKQGYVSREVMSVGVLAKAMSTLPERSSPSTLWLRPLMI